jgi:hypothetical protein
LSDLRISAFISGYAVFRNVLAIARFVFSSIGSWVNRLPSFLGGWKPLYAPADCVPATSPARASFISSIINARLITQKDHTHKLRRGLPQIVGAADSRHTKW